MNVFDAGLLASVIALSVPILLPALGELVSERAGVMNVGLEGMMLFGAFFAFLTVETTGNRVLGLVVGVLSGMSLALLMAILTVSLGADQIVVGVGINLIGSGVTIFINRELFLNRGQVTIDNLGSVSIPGLSSIPVVGKPLFDQPVVTYVAYACVAAVGWFLYRRRWGLVVRAAGELPEAVETSGGQVTRARYTSLMVAGAAAGLGGAFLTVVEVGIFIEGMTNGRGFLALAAVWFGGWRLRGVVLGALLFGGADALQLRLQSSSYVPGSVWYALGVVVVLAMVIAWRRRVTLSRVSAVVVVAVGAGVLGVMQWHLSVPAELWLALPYVLSVVALAGFAGRARLPSALAVPFDRNAI